MSGDRNGVGYSTTPYGLRTPDAFFSQTGDPSGIACTLGDSHLANAFSISGGAAFTAQGSSGSLTWFQTLLNQRIWVPYGCTNAGVAMGAYALAVSGTNADNVIASQLPAALSLNCGWAILSIGGNDLVSFPTRTFEQHCRSYRAIVEPLIASGKRVIGITIPPRDGTGLASSWDTSSLTAGQITTARRLQMRLNEWRRNYSCNTPGFYLADIFSQLVDPASSIGDPLSTVTADGQHLNTTGSFIAGSVMRDAVSTFLQNNVAGLGLTQADVYDSTDNPYGNQLSDGGTLNGTAGTVGSGGTGDAPSAYTAGRESGTLNTWVGTTQARTDTVNGRTVNGREWQAAVTGLETASLRLFQTAAISASNFTAGDYGFFEFQVDVSSITGTYQGVTAFWRHIAGPTYITYAMLPTGSETLGTTAWSGTIRTPIQQIYSGISSQIPYPRLNTINGGNFTAKIRSPRLQKVDITGSGIVLPGVDF